MERKQRKTIRQHIQQNVNYNSGRRVQTSQLPLRSEKQRGKLFSLKLISGAVILTLTTVLFAKPSNSAPIIDSVQNGATSGSREIPMNDPVREVRNVPNNHVSLYNPTSEENEIEVSNVQNEKNNSDNNDLKTQTLTDKYSISDGELEYTDIGLAKSHQFPSYEKWDEKYQADIAFFVQTSEVNIPLVPRVVERLWHENNIILIHVDAKVPHQLVSALEKRYTNVPKYSNVHFLPREPITYMGISMLLNTLNAMEYLLSLDRQWDYFMNLSGADYPLVSAKNMRIILGQPRILNQKVSFIQLAPGSNFWDRMQKFRFNVQYADPTLGLPPGSISDSKLISTYYKHPLREKLQIKFVQHEAWVTVHRSFALESARGSYGRRLLALLSGTKDPEEHFFGMLGWNTPHLNKTMAHYAGRGVYWRINGVASGQHPYVVDENQDKDGNYEFWPRILARANFFVRKFSKPDSSLMNLIDKFKIGFGEGVNQTSVDVSFKNLLRMTMCQSDIENNWYQENVVPCFKGGNKISQDAGKESYGIQPTIRIKKTNNGNQKNS